jgi:hypothetical protein
LRRFARLPSRILAVSAATFIGAIGAVAFAGPASATTADLASTVECVEGKPYVARVTWTLTSQDDVVGTVGDVKLNSDPAQVGAIKNGATMKAKGDKLVGSKDFSTDKRPPTLRGKVSWANEHTSTFRNDPVWPEGNCAVEPARKVTSNCDGTLTVHVTNADDKARRIAINGEGEYAERKTLEPGEAWEHVVPKKHAGKVTVKWKTAKENDDTDAGWEGQQKYEWVQPEACFDVTTKSTCDDLTITVANTGPKAIKATLTVGDTSEDKEIKPGASAEAVIDAVDGLVVKLTVNGAHAKDYAWAKPTDCSTGGLPVTGANAGLLAGAALVLVSGGGGLFYMARRRRIRFAA